MPPVKDTHTAQVSSSYHTTLSVDSVRRLQIFLNYYYCYYYYFCCKVEQCNMGACWSLYWTIEELQGLGSVVSMNLNPF